MKLVELNISSSGIIKTVGGKGEMRQHFLDMGLIPGVVVTVEKYAPMGDPIELRIHDYELTLRKDDASQIEVEEINFEQKTEKSSKIIKKEHPGFGEGGKYHEKCSENPLPKDSLLSFALVGNQNCGKTTLFNRLTGSSQHVGNFPGVTVDQKSGQIKNHQNTSVTDLPGIYSLSPYTNEEIVSREFIFNEKPSGIINIIDATNIERNLYLTMQLMELNTPMVLALNMMDEVRGNGGSIDINAMEDFLGIPIIPISAAKNEGIEELITHAIHVAKFQEKPKRTDFCTLTEKNGAVHKCLHAIMHLIYDYAEESKIPLRFAATKLIEGDEHIIKKLNFCENQLKMIEPLISQMEKDSGLDRAAAIADMRFSFITNLVEQTVVKPKESKERERSRKIDKIFTGKYTAIPSFIFIIATIFYLTFNVIGTFFQDLLEKSIFSFTQIISQFLNSLNVNSVLHSLIIDGVFNGVGSVLSFLPIIVTLFFFLSLLEDTGYMARVAFVMDKLLRKIGLSGRSIVPLLIGFGCTVPAIMASRTLPSERDRKMTILLTPFMSCTAKLPIYAFFSSVFFPKHTGLIMIFLYFFGMIIGIITALTFKHTLFKGEAIPFVMELPNYRMPGIKNVSQLLWEKAKDFLQKAFTVIFLASIIIWFLQTFDFRLNIVTDSQHSILAQISGFISPIFAPLGFDDWRICTSLITGFIAKESVVSTLSILFGTTQILTSIVTNSTALALLVFCLLYTPCVAAITSIKKELGIKWALGVVIFQCLVAWLCAFLIKLIF